MEMDGVVQWLSRGKVLHGIFEHVELFLGAWLMLKHWIKSTETKLNCPNYNMYSNVKYAHT